MPWKPCIVHLKEDIRPRNIDPRPCSKKYIECSHCHNPNCYGRYYQCRKCGLIGATCHDTIPTVFWYDIPRVNVRINLESNMENLDPCADSEASNSIVNDDDEESIIYIENIYNDCNEDSILYIENTDNEDNEDNKDNDPIQNSEDFQKSKPNQNGELLHNNKRLQTSERLQNNKSIQTSERFQNGESFQNVKTNEYEIVYPKNIALAANFTPCFKLSLLC
jgi:hypothetical protein